MTHFDAVVVSIIGVADAVFCFLILIELAIDGILRWRPNLPEERGKDPLYSVNWADVAAGWKQLAKQRARLANRKQRVDRLHSSMARRVRYRSYRRCRSARLNCCKQWTCRKNKH